MPVCTYLSRSSKSPSSSASHPRALRTSQWGWGAYCRKTVKLSPGCPEKRRLATVPEPQQSRTRRQRPERWRNHLESYLCSGPSPTRLPPTDLTRQTIALLLNPSISPIEDSWRWPLLILSAETTLAPTLETQSSWSSSHHKGGHLAWD